MAFLQAGEVNRFSVRKFSFNCDFAFQGEDSEEDMLVVRGEPAMDLQERSECHVIRTMQRYLSMMVARFLS